MSPENLNRLDGVARAALIPRLGEMTYDLVRGDGIAGYVYIFDDNKYLIGFVDHAAESDIRFFGNVGILNGEPELTVQNLNTQEQDITALEGLFSPSANGSFASDQKEQLNPLQKA